MIIVGSFNRSVLLLEDHHRSILNLQVSFDVVPPVSTESIYERFHNQEYQKHHYKIIEALQKQSIRIFLPFQKQERNF